MAEPKYVVARGKKGVGLAELVSVNGDVAVVRRFKGAMYRGRASRPTTFPPVTIPKADVLREATERELTLGHPA